MGKTSAVWRVVLEWLDAVDFPPTQSKLGERVGVTRQTVSDWKSGESRPSPEHLRRLADVMEPQLGAEVHERLVAAVAEDMGYGPGLRSLTETRSERRARAVERGLPTAKAARTKGSEGE